MDTVQTGGGIRTLETAGMLLGRGVKRVILGTSAVNDPMIVKTAAEKFNSSFAIAIDAKDGLVATEGWARTSGFTAVEFARKMEELGAKVIIYTTFQGRMPKVPISYGGMEGLGWKL